MKKTLLMFSTVLMLMVCFCVPAFAALCSGDNPGSECVYSDGVSCDYCGGCIHRDTLGFSLYSCDVYFLNEDYEAMEAGLLVRLTCSLCGVSVDWTETFQFYSPIEKLAPLLYCSSLSFNGVECIFDPNDLDIDVFNGDMIATFINDHAFVVNSDLTFVLPADFLMEGLIPSAAFTIGMYDEKDSTFSADYPLLSEMVGFPLTEDSPFLFLLFAQMPESFNVRYVPYGQLTGSASILPDVTSGVTSAASWVSTFATTVINTPILLISAVLAFIGFGIGIFKRIRT